MSDVIEVRELRCVAVVGVLEHEREHAQPLSFDLDIVRPLDRAASSDDLALTTNYAEILSLTVRVAQSGGFFLLEALVYRVANEILAVDPLISSVEVSVKKLRPPVGEDVATVGVRCRVERAP